MPKRPRRKAMRRDRMSSEATDLQCSWENVFEQGWRLPYGPQMSAQPVGRRMNSDQPKRLGWLPAEST